MIRQENINGVHVATLDDGKLNIFNFEMLDALLREIETASSAQAPLVIAGRPGVFSAGLDLSLVNDASTEELYRLFNETGRVVRALLAAPVPVVAASTGHAVALGALMLTACDWRIGAAGSYRIGVNATANGIHLPQAFLALMRARLAPEFLMRAALGAEIFDPDGARDAGFYDATAPKDAIVELAVKKAVELGAFPKAIFSAHKHTLNAPVLDQLV